MPILIYRYGSHHETRANLAQTEVYDNTRAIEPLQRTSDENVKDCAVVQITIPTTLKPILDDLKENTLTIKLNNTIVVEFNYPNLKEDTLFSAYFDALYKTVSTACNDLLLTYNGRTLTFANRSAKNVYTLSGSFCIQKMLLCSSEPIDIEPGNRRFLYANNFYLGISSYILRIGGTEFSIKRKVTFIENKYNHVVLTLAQTRIIDTTARHVIIYGYSPVLDKTILFRSDHSSSIIIDYEYKCSMPPGSQMYSINFGSSGPAVLTPLLCGALLIYNIGHLVSKYL